MAGRLAIAAVTSRVTLKKDRFCVGSQPAARNALSISAAVPSNSTLNGSPNTVPVRFSERGTNFGKSGISVSSRCAASGSQGPPPGRTSGSVSGRPPISPARMRTGGPRRMSEKPPSTATTPASRSAAAATPAGTSFLPTPPTDVLPLETSPESVTAPGLAYSSVSSTPEIATQRDGRTSSESNISPSRPCRGQGRRKRVERAGGGGGAAPHGMGGEGQHLVRGRGRPHPRPPEVVVMLAAGDVQLDDMLEGDPREPALRREVVVVRFEPY